MYKALERFIKLEAAGGIALFIATILALFLSNSSWAVHYQTWLNAPLSIQWHRIGLTKPFFLWVNEGLMAIFFCLVSLEIKREFKQGSLVELKQRSLPAIAAVGGMLVPALIYLCMTHSLGVQAMQGWAIPTATDIAFSLGVLSLVGKRVPLSLKVLLTAIAIFDDLAGIVIIALFYTAKINTWMLLAAGIGILILALFNHFNVKALSAYVLIGFAIWLSVLKSGVHATLAGVVLAMFLPMHPSNSLALRVEKGLHYWVAFAIVPLFALANAGINIADLTVDALVQPISLGVFFGLFLGKQVGVTGFVWLAERFKLAQRPAGLTWAAIWGVSLLCGIGFTMSLFLGALAFPAEMPALQQYVKLGVFLGSLLSGIIGVCVLRFSQLKKS